jgi:hypothetical protein
MYANFLSEKLKGRDHSEDLGVEGKIKVKLKLSLCFLL